MIKNRQLCYLLTFKTDELALNKMLNKFADIMDYKELFIIKGNNLCNTKFNTYKS